VRHTAAQRQVSAATRSAALPTSSTTAEAIWKNAAGDRGEVDDRAR
jgi:hypothetical protein